MLERLGESEQFRILDGLTGISVTAVCAGSDFYCLLTDRGILLTAGNGQNGCLGHGDLESIKLKLDSKFGLADECTKL